MAMAASEEGGRSTKEDWLNHAIRALVNHGIDEVKVQVIARDRMLVVNAPASSTPPGWHAEGYAITDVSAMYHVFEFEGPGLPDLIAEAMFVDPRAQSPSAATVFAGQQAIVYHRDGKLRVHVERGFAPYIWQWLEARD